MRRQYIYLVVTLITYLSVGFSSSLWAQDKISYKVKYTKYSSGQEIIKDVTITTTQFPIYSASLYVVGKDTLSDGVTSCNCRIQIYNPKGYLIDEVYEPAGDQEMYEKHSYSYDDKGQLISKDEKLGNLPWMGTRYEYDREGKLLREDCSTARYGECYVEYIYDNGKLIYKVTKFEGQIDTLRFVK
jgi:hypothetical protein